MNVADGRVVVEAWPFHESVESVPFEMPEGSEFQGRPLVQPVSDGWLVGFDSGEFGGGLWWFGPDGSGETRIFAPRDTAASDDPFKAENVRALLALNGETLVLMGLDHLTGRSGRVFRAVRRGGRWAIELIGVLDASPAGWATDGHVLYIVTQGGLWIVEPRGAPRLIYPADLELPGPSAMVRKADGTLIVGTRHYILELVEEGSGWRPAWYAPANCKSLRTVEHECRCNDAGTVPTTGR